MLRGLLLIISITLSHQLSTPTSPTYEAGVVEFNFGSQVNMTSKEMLEENLNKYFEIMDSAPSTLDVIVFPEMTLNGMLTAAETPEPADKISPCDEESYESGNLVKKISCKAKLHKRYVVVNMITKATCPDADMIENKDSRKCNARPDGFSYYNTNVVFDRDGRVISRYRKFNLFGESVDKPAKPAMIKFETDFGVTFGHFICFDLMFKQPALDLVDIDGLTDIIFTTMWFSELPFLTAVQVQQNWAHSKNVNLLASGANHPEIGSTGSGIYAGKKGAIVIDMNGEKKSQLYTATIHKKKNFPQNDEIKINHDIHRYSKTVMKPLKLKRDQLDAYDMNFLNDYDGSHFMQQRSCEKNLCCEFKITYSIANSDEIPHYQYAVAFYHGNRTFDGFADGNVVACSILACQTKNISTCGIRNEELENIHIWESIEIVGDLPNENRQFFYLPSTLDTSILPLQPEQFGYSVAEKENNKVEIKMTLTENAENLLTFGIYGRDFNGAISVTSKVTLILFAIVTILKFI